MCMLTLTLLFGSQWPDCGYGPMSPSRGLPKKAQIRKLEDVPSESVTPGGRGAHGIGTHPTCAVAARPLAGCSAAMAFSLSAHVVPGPGLNPLDIAGTAGCHQLRTSGTSPLPCSRGRTRRFRGERARRSAELPGCAAVLRPGLRGRDLKPTESEPCAERFGKDLLELKLAAGCESSGSAHAKVARTSAGHSGTSGTFGTFGARE